jgi:hypothetical protein
MSGNIKISELPEATSLSVNAFVPVIDTVGGQTTTYKVPYDVVGGIPVVCTGAEINTGVNDNKFASPKAIADSDIAFLSDIPTVPTVASAAEVIAGTDNVKYTSPKALKDAGIVPATGTDYRVSVSATDTTTSYLDTKLTA